MVSLRNYFCQLKEILKAQCVSYFVLLALSAFFILGWTVYAFLTRQEWVVPGLLALFLFSFIFQHLFLRKKCYVLFLFKVLILIAFVIQISWNIYDQVQIHPHQNGQYFQLESTSPLGVSPQPNLRNNPIAFTIDKDTVNVVIISLDSARRRIPDDAFMEEYLANRHHPVKHAVFLGCSFTFGAGLMYSSTFPYLFEKLNPDYKSYNYGVVGFGPHQIALLFDKRVNIINESSISERDGFALYSYIDDHLNRVYGGSVYLSWAYYPPNVFVENDSLIIRKWPLFQRLNSRILADVALLRYFDITINYPKSDDFYKRFADIINYTAKKYRELKPGNHFYVGIYPGQNKDLNWIQYLDEKIIVLKVTPPSDYDDKSKYQVNMYDHHPSKASNLYYAEELTRLISEYESTNNNIL